MSKISSCTNKQEIYGIGSFALNFLLMVAVIFVAIYLIASLVGDRIYVDAIIKYTCWIVIALVAKNVLKRAMKGLRIRAYDYALVGLSAIANIVFWFAYPFNIILILLCIIGVVFSYRAHTMRMKNDL